MRHITAKADSSPLLAHEILIVGRLFNILLLGLSLLWVPLITQIQGGQMFFYIKAIAAYLAPPIGAVYVLAVFWKRCNESGAFYGLMVGLIVGMIRLTLDFVFRSPECGLPDLRPDVTKRVHYMYFAAILFALTVVTGVSVSLATPAPPTDKLIRTTLATRHDPTVRLDDFRYDRRRKSIVFPVLDVSNVELVEKDHMLIEENEEKRNIATEKTEKTEIKSGVRSNWNAFSDRTSRFFMASCCRISPISSEETDAHEVRG